MGLTTVGRNLLANFLMRTSATATRPTVLYLLLTTATITTSSTLSNITEEDDPGYARQKFSESDGDPEYFGAPTDGVMTNGTAIQFNYTNAASSAVTYAGVTNAANGTSGSLYGFTQLGTSKTPGAGDKLEFAIGALSFSIQ